MNEEVIREEREFPSDLQKRMAAVLNGVNTELKAVTILHLDDKPVEFTEIRDRVRETRGEGYLPRPNNFGTYSNTLHNIALVAKETIVRDTGEKSHIGYNLTEAGKIYGRQIAAFSLRYAVESGRSMYEILGSTRSKGVSRAPHNRVIILEKLDKEGLRRVDLVNILKLSDSGIAEHIKNLSKISFISFDSIGAKQKGKCRYRWVEGKDVAGVKTVVSQKTLTKNVSSKLIELGKSDRNEIAESLDYDHLSHVSKVLCGLEEQGFVERVSWKGSRWQSKIEILEDGRKFLEGFVSPVKEILEDSRLLSDEEIDEIRREYTDKGIKLYRSISPYINKKSSEQRIEQVRTLVRENPGITSRNICKIIGLAKGMISSYLKQIKEIRKEKEGHEVRYFLK